MKSSFNQSIDPPVGLVVAAQEFFPHIFDFKFKFSDVNGTENSAEQTRPKHCRVFSEDAVIISRSTIRVSMRGWWRW